MSTWKTASLGEIFEIARGGSPRPIQDYLTDDPNGVNWISISDASASSKFITATKKRIRPEGVSRSRMVKPGDFLLTNSMSFGRPYIMGTTGCIHDGWLVLSSKHDDVDQDYFFQLLSSDFIYAKFSKLAAGATVKNLNIDLVSGVEVTFPPLEEQRRIAAILDQAETLRTQRRTALALLDSLTQSLFLDMFGDPVANDRGWPKVTVNDFVAGFESGKSLVADDEEDSASKYRVLKVSAVTSLEYKPEQSKAVPTDYAPPQSHIVRAGDLLFSRANTSELIGATAYVEETPDNLLLPDKLWRFVWHAPSKAAPLYVMHLFRQPKFRQEIGQRASGTSGSMKNISQEKVLSIQVGNPPLPLQQTFATRIASIEALKTTHRRALAALDALFASLQQRAFAGELVASPAATQYIPAHKTVDNVEDLRTLEGALGLEALIFVAKRTAGNDVYAALKTLYIADKQHLEHYGRLIYGETYNALPMGPVPEAAYETIKFLRDLQQMFCSFGDSNVRAALRAEGSKRLVPLRDADLNKLGADAVQSLEAAIRYFANSDFGQVKTATHDSAYERTPPNQRIPVRYIIDMLPAEARQRHWNV